MIARAPKHILLVGAYERDNFGDILFAIITKHILERSGYTAVLSSFVYSDMRQVFGEYIYSYDMLLRDFEWDAIWVVGGEVGNAGLGDALRLTMGEVWSDHRSALKADMASAIDGLAGMPLNAQFAYIPNRANYKKNESTPLVMNSVGGFSDAGVYQDETFLGTNSILASTRNARSRDILTKRGLEGTLLSPDIVHVVCEIFPHQKSQRATPYMLVQLNAELLASTTRQTFIDELESVASSKKMDIVFFAAGVAPGHDDIQQYLNIRNSLKRKNRRLIVRVCEERDPIELVKLIADATLWIGSSLHGRIVAASYGVPRVSFSKFKLNEYSERWDPDMPYNVQPSNFRDAAITALEADSGSIGQELSKKAIKNIEELISKLDLMIADNQKRGGYPEIDTTSLHLSQAEQIKGAVGDVLRVAATTQEMADTREKTVADLAEERNSLINYRNAYEEIRGSLSYKIGRLITTPIRPLRVAYNKSRHKLGLVKNRRKLLRSIDDVYAPDINRKGLLRVDLVIRSYEYPTSSMFIRLLSPLTSGPLNGKVNYRFVNGEKPRLSRKADAVIVQRTAIAHVDDAKELVAEVRQNGAKLFVDTDDAFSELDKNHPQYALQKERVDALNYVIENADELWVSTEPLLQLHEAKVSKVVRNTVDEKVWTRLASDIVSVPEKEEPLQILYMGTKTHDKDFQVLLPALKRLHTRHPGEFQFHIIGVASQTDNYPWLVEHQPTDSLYPNFVAWFNQLQPIDIGVSPLEDSAFNHNKSDIKCLDYLALGVKPVVSDVEAYRNPELDDHIVRVSNTPNDWYSALETELLNRESERKKAPGRIRRGYKYLRDYRLSDKAAEVIAKSILEKG